MINVTLKLLVCLSLRGKGRYNNLPYLIAKTNAVDMDQNKIAQAAAILANNLIDVLNDTRAPHRRLEEAPRPFAATRWRKQETEHISSATWAAYSEDKTLGGTKNHAAPGH